MNLQEFAALKVGDKIENPMSPQRSIGTISETTASGVRVRWGSDSGVPQFFYSVQTTAWMHWTKVEEPQAAETGTDNG